MNFPIRRSDFILRKRGHFYFNEMLQFDGKDWTEIKIENNSVYWKQNDNVWIEFLDNDDCIKIIRAYNKWRNDDNNKILGV